MKSILNFTRFIIGNSFSLLMQTTKKKQKKKHSFVIKYLIYKYLRNKTNGFIEFKLISRENINNLITLGERVCSEQC